MASIPKRVLERFSKMLPRFQKVLQIAKDRDVNESDTVAIINDILGEVFGYDKYIEITSEFCIRSTYCDLAIKVDGKVQFLIEAKAIGIDLRDNHLRQAIDYGANQGIQWVVLTNGIDWRVYRIRFEQPINYDLVCRFDFLQLNAKIDNDRDCLFLLSKEALSKNVRQEFYEKAQSVNRYVIGQLVASAPVLTVLRRELKRLSEGVKVDEKEVLQLILTEVLKREVVEGEEAEAAQARVEKYYKKCSRKQQKPAAAPPIESNATESISERLLRETEVEEAKTETAIVGDD